MAMMVEISDEAYAVLRNHASANGETDIQAMNELFSVADKVWCMDMPEMRKVWQTFRTRMHEA